MTSQAAHRVVQESLTNAARHAPGARVTVTVAAAEAGTRIDVVNEAAANPSNPAGNGAGTGQGLIGLAERVRLAGGRLDAGPQPDGSWAVTATLPDDARPTTPDGAGFELRGSKRLTRRRQLQTAALPVGVGIAMFVALIIAQVINVQRTGLAHDRFNALRIGMPRAEVESLLPPRDLDQRPQVVDEPPRPRRAGASCVYYQAGDAVTDIDPDSYRLCFAGGELVSKHRLKRA
jgi:hypothetical protein